MDGALKKGFYLAGFISYEAGYAFEERLSNNKIYDFPLLYFGVYENPHPLSRACPPMAGERAVNHKARAKEIQGEGLTVSKTEYLKKISRIKEHLAAGDSYQVNYTFKTKFNYSGDHYSLYRQLARRQPTPYSAFLRTDNFSILSLSPELFFRKEGNKILVKPMKGTIAPGKGKARLLRNDSKNRSENLMIVDLLRNDLGRVARVGSVKPVKLFEIEKHKTLYQMTSSLQAEIDPAIDLFSLFRHLFPSGSVTGAPKIRTMEIIRRIEKEERKIYTGAIGYITPEREMSFNVAIRTLLLNGSKGEMGIGSGVTFGSDPICEYKECLLKAEFLFGNAGCI